MTWPGLAFAFGRIGGGLFRHPGHGLRGVNGRVCRSPERKSGRVWGELDLSQGGVLPTELGVNAWTLFRWLQAGKI
ncbi:MAG: hypothetical protein RI897_4064 [Verrucomicrobiota bacterium]|jgi:hypothetical protein